MKDRLSGGVSQGSDAASSGGDGASDSDWLRKFAAIPRPGVVPLTRGERLGGGRYRIDGLLGRGGMGLVYGAWDEERRETVALKTVLETSAASIYRLKQEFRSLARVHGEHLLPLYDLFEEDGRWCFTMQRVNGRTLRDALPGMTQPLLRDTFAQLLRGVSTIHAAGKLHRDLKPSNVMLSLEGHVVILDFGLVAEVGGRGASKGVFASSMSGTPAYLAPEQASGGLITPASDWYAFGVMLFETLAGQLPFSGTADRVLIDKQWLSAPTLRQLRPDVPADLDALCQALLERNPEQRPSESAIAAALTGARGAAAEASGVVAHRAQGGVALVEALVGREEEAESLTAAYGASIAGDKPVVVLVSGESGIGKSALCDGFVATLDEALVLSGRCYECESVPFKGFDAIVDALSRYLARLSNARLGSLLPPDFLALCTLFPVLGRLPAVAPRPELLTGDSHELRRRAFLALGELLGAVSAIQPIVLYVDDVQWSDADSTLLLMHLLRQADAPRLLVIAAHRSEGSPDNPCLQPLHEVLPRDIRLDVRRLTLAPLSALAARALLEGHGLVVSTELVEQARGNPFLLRELSWHHTRRGPAEAGTLDDAVRARVGALPEEQQRALELFALAGRPLEQRLAQGALSIDRWYPLVEALCEARFLRQDARGGELSCYHDRIREAVARSVHPARARQHHRRLGLSLIRHSSPDPEHLALHLEGAGHAHRAAEQLVLAARRAEGLLAFQRAALSYGRALELGRFEPPVAQRLVIAQADAFAAAGQGLDAVELYLAAMPSAAPEDAQKLCHKAAEQCIYSGRQERGLELLRRALRGTGVRVPKTVLGTVASFLYSRARLALRGHAFETRDVPAALAEHITSLQRTGRALASVDGLRAIDLGLQAFLSALDAGYAPAVSNGVVGELWMGLLFGAGDRQLVRLVARARDACKRTGGFEERALLHIVLASVAFMKPEPDYAAALDELARFRMLQNEHPLPGSSYQLTWAEFNRAYVQCHLGELSDVAREVPAQLDAAWARGDVNIMPMWAGGMPSVARIGVGDDAGVERDLERARAAWSSPVSTFQDLSLFSGELLLHGYRGELRAAFECADSESRRLRASPLGRTHHATDIVESARARTAVALAAEARGTERSDLVKLARRVARGRCSPVKLSLALRRDFVEVGLCCSSGDIEGAVTRLRRTLPSIEAVPLFFHAGQYRLGRLLGGDEGRLLLQRSDTFFREAGAADAERFVSALLPGCGR